MKHYDFVYELYVWRFGYPSPVHRRQRDPREEPGPMVVARWRSRVPLGAARCRGLEWVREACKALPRCRQQRGVGKGGRATRSSVVEDPLGNLVRNRRGREKRTLVLRK